MDQKKRDFNRNLRTIFMYVSILNQFVCSIASITNYVGNEKFIIIYNIISTILTGVSSTLAWWYNNSFTDKAKRGDDLMYGLKEFDKEENNKKIFIDKTIEEEGE